MYLHIGSNALFMLLQVVSELDFLDRKFIDHTKFIISVMKYLHKIVPLSSDGKFFGGGGGGEGLCA